MNRPPISSTSSVISSYRKRRQRRGSNLIVILAALLFIGGIILLILWLSGSGKPLKNLFATDTPTPTMTSTPTITPIPTETPTITSTPTETATSTPAAPFAYTVQEGESLATIAGKYNLGDNGILLLLALNPTIDPVTQIVFVGQQIIVPNPGMQLPTATPIPPGLPRGTKVDYIVQPGDSLAAIASKFNSTADDIITENKLEDPNAIFVGQLLVIPVNMVTTTATRPPTSTPSTPSAAATITVAPTGAPGTTGTP